MNGKILENNWEMIGWELDDPWVLRSHFRAVLRIPRSEKSRKYGGHSEKVYEKRPHEARFCELHKVLIS